MKITTRVNGLAHIAALALCLAACGDDAPPPVAPAPPPPVAPAPVVGIGTSGGTVTHASGAKVVVPAGALTQNTVIEITQSSAGAPPLPAGVTSAGLVFAFTPHGTTFAVPATVTVPFDPALVPAGATLVLYKTNAAQTAYEPVAGAVVSGNSLVGEVTSFSLLTTGVVVPPVTVALVVRSWSFAKLLGDTLKEELVEHQLEMVDVDRVVDFGPAQLDAPYRRPSGEVFAPDGRAVGLVASFNQGNTFWVGTEAPAGNSAIKTDAIGSRTTLVQYQMFRKNTANASYRYVLSGLVLQGFDGNGVLGRFCPPHRVLQSVTCDLVGAQYVFDVVAYKPDPATGSDLPSQVFYRVAGGDALYGSAIEIGGIRPTWLVSDTTSGLSRYSLEALGAQFDVPFGAFNGPNGTRLVRLTSPGVVNLDLSTVPVGGTFMVRITSTVRAYDRAAGVVSGQGAEFATASHASLRDPAEALGPTSVAFSGLTPVDVPVPVVDPVETPVEPAPCLSTPSPDPAAGTIQFSAPTYRQNESGTQQVVTVTRTGGSRGAVTATFGTSNGSAIAGVDYTAVNASVFFADGDAAARTVEVATLPDDIAGEPNKTVILTLSQPGGCAALGSQTTAVLTIVDDDIPPQTLFTVGGTVTGLGSLGGLGEPPNATRGRGLELIDHHGLSLIITADGPFTFTNIPSPTGTAYSVRTGIQPLGFGNVVVKRCTVTDGSGVIANANVTNIQVICTDP